MSEERQARRLAVVGTGSLARAFCYAFAVLLRPGERHVRVGIGGRSFDSAAEIAAVANARAGVAGKSCEFEPSDLGSSFDRLPDWLGTEKPDVLLHVASLQSPWTLSENSAWADLIRNGGFGITLPLQALLAMLVAQAIRQASPATLLVNGCYPDAVNPLLSTLAVPVACGVGNVAILAAVAAAQFKRKANVRIVAHHYHVAALSSPNSMAAHPPRVWLDGEEMPFDRELFCALRIIRGAELNQITGIDAARTVDALLGGVELRTHVPGPNGMPGGYPVILSAAEVRLDLPESINFDAARSQNQTAADLDGVRLEPNGKVQFSERARLCIRRYSKALAAPFLTAELDSIARAWTELRRSLGGR